MERSPPPTRCRCSTAQLAAGITKAVPRNKTTNASGVNAEM
jgi:hypothetical protein